MIVIEKGESFDSISAFFENSIFSFKIDVEIWAIFMIKNNLPINNKTSNPSIGP